MPQNEITYAQKFLAKFHAYQEEYLKRLEMLVNIDSGTGQVKGINQIVSHLQQWLSDLGCQVKVYPVERYGENLVARLRGRGEKRILLVGHLDTVYAPGAAKEQPFAVRDGFAYGPGVLDMKSGVLLAIYTLRALVEEAFDGYREIIILFNNDEEVGSPGSAFLFKELAQQVDCALVLEPAGKESSLTHARKGTDRYFMEVTGVAAHSGVEPYKGRSAVVELAQKIIAVQQLHALLPGVTFNITRLSSSETLNVIPDRASCFISVRAFTKSGLDSAEEALNKLVQGSSVPDTHTLLTRYPGRTPYEATPAIMRIVDLAKREGLALKVQLHAEAKGGVSDANLLVDAGLPVLDTLGPVGGGMHNLEREHMRLSSVPIRGALLAGLIQRLCLQYSSVSS